MSENLGVASGSLDLDLSNLHSAIQSAVKDLKRIDQQGDLTQSEMRKLESASKGTADIFQTAAQRSRDLSSQLQTSKQRASGLKDAISGLNTIIQRSKDEQKKLEGQIQQTSIKQKQQEEKVRALSERYKEAKKNVDAVTKAHGEESDEAKEAAETQEKVAKAYENATQKADSYRNQLLQLESRHKYLENQVKDSKDQIVDFKTKLNDAETQTAELSRELEKSESKLRLYGEAAQQAGDKWKNAGEKMSRIGGALTLGVTTPIAALGIGAFNTAKDFESAFTGVTKTVDGTAQQIANLRQGIINMSQEIPSSTTEISAVAEAAGQLGIQTDNVLDFTRVMIDLGNSTNLSAEEAASSLAKFANVSGMLPENYQRLGSTIVDLGNNFATTEADIVAMGTRLVGAGTQLGMTEPQILGFATALSSVGIEAEAGGSSFSTLMSNMQLAVEQGGDDLQQFADVAGMSAADFKTAFQEDAAGAIISFIEGLSDCDERGLSAIGVLDDMGITEIRMRDALLRAAGASDVFSEAIDTGTSAWGENIALTDEANKRYGTTESKMAIAMNSIKEAGRSIGEDFLPVVADVAKDVASAAKAFSQLSPETKKTIVYFAGAAAAAGPLVKTLGSVTKGIGGLKSGIGALATKLADKSAAKSAAKAIENVGTNAVTATKSTGLLTKGFSALGGPLGVAVVAATAISGIAIAIKHAHDEAVKDNLKDHFGDIKLSAEEVEDVAKRLTTNAWTMKIDAVMDAKSKLSEMEENVSSSVEELNKLGWKIGIGLELTDEEKKSFQETTQKFVQDSQALMEQQSYTMTLAIDAIMTPGTDAYRNLKDFTTNFFLDSQEDLSDLGGQMADAVDQALADGIITEDEYLNIQGIQQKIQKLMDKVSEAEYEVQMEKIAFEAPRSGIDADSFQKVIDACNEQIQTRFDSADDALVSAITPLKMQLKAGEISQAQYDEMVQQAQMELANNKGYILLDSIDVEIGTLKTNYSDVAAQFDSDMHSFSQDLASRVKNEDYGWAYAWSDLESVFTKSIGQVSGDAKGAIEKMMESMQPQKAQLEAVKQNFVDAGKIPPQSIVDGLNDIYQWEALGGSVDHLYDLMAKECAESDSYRQIIENYTEQGYEIPAAFSQALKDNYGLVYDAQKKSWTQIKEKAFIDIEDLKAKYSDAGIEIPDALLASLQLKEPQVQQGTINLLSSVVSGTQLKQEELQTLFQNLGYDLPDSMVTSMSSKEPSVQTQAISLLNQLKYAEESQRQPIIDQLGELIGLTVDEMNELLDESSLQPPEMDDIDASSWASRNVSALQANLNDHYLVVGMKAGALAGLNAVPHAAGGIFDTPHIGLVAEAGAESIIPLSASSRSRGIELWAETGQLLGVGDALDSVSASYGAREVIRKQNTSNGSDTADLARQIAVELEAAFRKAPVEVNPQFQVSQGDVYLGNEKTGRALAPVISRILANSL